MISAVTKSADDTREMGAQLASLALPGDVVLLSGDLGAGKTTFTQGFGRGLGVDEPVEGRLVDVAVRAALGTGAGIRVVPPGAAGPTDGMGAVLRWSA